MGLLDRKVSPEVFVPLIGGLLSGLVMALLLLALDAPRFSFFVAFHAGFVCGAVLVMAMWVFQLRRIAGKGEV